MPTTVAPPDQSHPDPVIQRTLDWLRSLVYSLGLTKRVRGTVSVSTTASVSGSTTVTHGLGTTPAVVLATGQTGSVTIGTLCSATNIGATTFDLGIRYGDGTARTGSVTVGWEAIA